MRLLFDTNVILDVLLNRPPWVTDASGVWKACDEGHAAGFIVASTFSTLPGALQTDQGRIKPCVCASMHLQCVPSTDTC